MAKRKVENSDDDLEPPKKMIMCRYEHIAKHVVIQAPKEFTRDSDEMKLYRMASKPNREKADFREKYCRHSKIGAGGFGLVYKGTRKCDGFRVAIKYIYNKDVKWKKVTCQGEEFKINLEVALMLKAAGLPESAEKSAAVSLLDWYMTKRKTILVMERPRRCMNLGTYLTTRDEYPTELEAKVILKQLVDAAVDMHSKGVFHRDIKLENVLVDTVSGQPRVRVVDFGCGTFSSEATYQEFCGTWNIFPPEFFETGTYWAHPTTVWQLGALFYSVLQYVKSLLHMCLEKNPMKRIPLVLLQVHPTLTQVSSPLTSDSQ
ncbi:serine/threonine-protein kinase pim-2-like [Antennarius striatus]|uniref:serine/threonine-protein kinase pim-2-like n=1 Tax=Antennarius striatus TaxID=241820 RepID=UPI0035AE24ED